MVNDADMYKFDEFRTAVTKKFFDDCGGMMAVEERPLLYCSFLQVCVWGGVGCVWARMEAQTLRPGNQEQVRYKLAQEH